MKQSRRPLSCRVSVKRDGSQNEIELWRRAVGELMRTPHTQRLFELTDEGVLLPWADAGS